MPRQAVVLERRNKISEELAKSNVNPRHIAEKLNLEAKTVTNDLQWMKKNSMKWLSGHALDGYVFETQNTIEQLRNIELELQQMREEETDKEMKLKIIHQLGYFINMRWVMQGDGPALMAARYAAQKAIR